MTHMTVIHWLIIVFFIVLYIGTIVAARKERKPKIFWSMVFASSLVNVMLMGFSLYVTDVYTKKARVYNVKNTRLLREEKMVLQGWVVNDGSFNIGKVTLNVKLANKGLSLERIKGTDLYNPSTNFIDYFKIGKDQKRERRNTIIIDFIIAKNLKPGKSKRFYVKLPYPPHFKRPSLFTKIYAH